MFKITGFGAIALPGRRIVLMDHHWHDEKQINHEIAHVEQYERMGTARFLWTYLKLFCKHGYHKNPLEIEARRYENRH
jgi:hypothetical protein